MDWANESYVRVYIRDTTTWLRLRWEGQVLFMLLIRKCDRAGVLDGIEDPVDDLSLITGLPVEHVKAGYERLIKKGVIELRENLILIPNYIEAQEAARSDAQRQRELRMRRRSEANSKSVTDRDGTDTERDKKSQPVTDGHDQSQPVTLCSTLPCSTSSALPSLLCSDGEKLVLTPSKKKGAITKAKNKEAKSAKTWAAYSLAYELRYGTAPIRNGKQNRHLCDIVDRLGADVAPDVAQYYLYSNNAYYATRGHALGILLADCEKVHMEWKTGTQITQAEAREQDRLSNVGKKWQKIIDEVGE